MKKTEENLIFASVIFIILLMTGTGFAGQKIKKQTTGNDIDSQIFTNQADKKTQQKKRFIVNNDNTVLDTRTGLMWAAEDNGTDIGWADAKKYCENYKGGGYSNWRMPNIKELEGIDIGNLDGYMPDCSAGEWSVYITNSIILTCCCLWASDTLNSSAGIFNFNYGNWGWYHQANVHYVRVLPVRNKK
ncbi:DUF1566 domain-containing protein [Desulfobacterales bacterium HSG16]|nr:DUF1566 domain-containing protein [Desulfobacterales bacterium HSG16]